MNFDYSGSVPLFQQVAEQIEEAIFSGAFKEQEQIPSTTEISKSYQINPATVLKGMNILVDKGLIEKKRGIGMFVLTGAQQKIKESKKNIFLNERMTQLIQEAKNLGITSEQLVKLIESGYKK